MTSGNAVLLACLFLMIPNVDACDLIDLEPLALQVPSAIGSDKESRKVLLSNNRVLDALAEPGVLQLQDAATLALVSRISGWADGAVISNDIVAQPAVLDSNADGIAEAIYALDTSGKLWFINLSASGFLVPKLIADFSETGHRFSKPLQLVNTRTRISTDLMVYHDATAVTLLIISTDEAQKDSLFVFHHRASETRLVTAADMLDRTALSAADADPFLLDTLWRNLQQSAGWLIRLDASIVSKPQIYAGVVYVNTVNSRADRLDCAIPADESLQIYALHLYHGGAVYSHRSWHIDATGTVSWTLDTDEEGALMLMLHSETDSVPAVSEMLSISEQCADCTERLNAEQFPRQYRLATFINEEGAF